MKDCVFVFDGKFDLPLAAAYSELQQARNLAQEKQLDEAGADHRARDFRVSFRRS